MDEDQQLILYVAYTVGSLAGLIILVLFVRLVVKHVHGRRRAAQRTMQPAAAERGAREERSTGGPAAGEGSIAVSAAAPVAPSSPKLLRSDDSYLWKRQDTAASLTNPDQSVCVICLANKPSVVSAPCGHLSYCRACFQELRAMPTGTPKACVVCRCAVEALLPVTVPKCLASNGLCNMCNKQSLSQACITCGTVSACTDCLASGGGACHCIGCEKKLMPSNTVRVFL